MVCWLITWESVGKHAQVENKIAAVLNPRLSSDKVRDIVELIHVNSYFSLAERLAYAKNKYTPYPAYFAKRKGISIKDRIYCGLNPYLYARLVDGIHVRVNKNRDERLVWRERQRPQEVWWESEI